jgi:hypothetical protein
MGEVDTTIQSEAEIVFARFKEEGIAVSLWVGQMPRTRRKPLKLAGFPHRRRLYHHTDILDVEKSIDELLQRSQYP